MARGEVRYRFTLDGQQFETSVSKMIRNMTTFGNEVSRLEEHFSGRQAEQRMEALALAIKGVGGTTKLTTAQVDELNQRVNSLHAAGAKIPGAFQGLGTLASQGATTGRVLDATKNSAEDLARGLAASTGSFGSLAAAAGPYGLAIAAGIGVGVTAAYALGSALADAVNKASEAGGRLADFSTQTKMSAESLQEMEAGAITAGVSLDTLADMATKAQTMIGQGAPEFAGALDQLGLKLKDLRKLAPEEQFRAMAQAVVSLEDPTQRAAAATALLGKGGAKDIAGLKEWLGGAGAEARGLGQVMSNETVAGLDAFGDSTANLQKTWDHLWINIGAAIATTPGVKKAIDDLAGAVGDMSVWVQQNKGAIQAFVQEAVLPLVHALADVVRLLQTITSLKTSAGSALGALGALTGSSGMVNVGLALQGGLAGPRTVPGDPGSGVSGYAGKRAPTYDPAAWAAARKAAEDLRKEMEKWATTGAQKSMDLLERAIRAAGGTAGLSKAKFHDLVEEVRKLREAGAEAVTGLLSFANTSAGAAGTYAADLYQAGLAHRTTMTPVEPMGDAAIQAAFTAGGVGGNVILPGMNEAVDSAGRLLKTTKEIRQEAADLGKELMGVQKATSGIATVAGMVSEAFIAMGGSADSGLGRMISGLAQGAEAGARFASQIREGMTGGQIGAVAGEAAISIWQTNRTNRSGTNAALSGAATGAMTGAAIGSLFAGVGAIPGAIIGALVGGFIGYFSGSAWRNACRQASQVLRMEVSDALMQAIQATQTQLGVGVSTAALLNLGRAMDEAHAAGGNMRDFFNQTDLLIAGVANGTIPAVQGLEQVGLAFNRISAEAIRAGSVGDNALRHVIRAARAAHQTVAEIDAFVKEQLGSGVAGLAAGVGHIVTPEAAAAAREQGRTLTPGTVTGGIQVITPEDAVAQATIAAAMFDQVWRTQGPLAAAELFADLGPTLEASLAAFPDQVDAIMGPMRVKMALLGNDAFTGAVTGLEGYRSALQSLANTDAPLATAQFAAFGQVAVSGFNQARDAALEQGFSMEQANQMGIEAAGPFLQDIINASRNYGITIDANTQALIDQAEAAGYSFATPPMDRAASAILLLVDVLAQMNGIVLAGADNFDAMGNSAEKAGRKGSAAMPTTPSSVPPGEPIPSSPSPTGAASGWGPSIAPNLGGGLGPLIQTHAGEGILVVPRSRVRRGGLFGAERGFGDRPGPGGHGDPGDRPGPGGGGGTGGGSGSGGLGGGNGLPGVLGNIEEGQQAIAAALRALIARPDIQVAMPPVAVQVDTTGLPTGSREQFLDEIDERMAAQARAGRSEMMRAIEDKYGSRLTGRR